MATLDRETLEAALVGYKQQKDAIDIKIAQLRAQLSGHVAAVATLPKKGRRAFSAETRLRMAVAQQKRWAAKRAPESPKPNKKVAVKKRGALSPEARGRIAEAQRKRWASAKKAAK